MLGLVGQTRARVGLAVAASLLFVCGFPTRSFAARSTTGAALHGSGLLTSAPPALGKSCVRGYDLPRAPHFSKAQLPARVLDAVGERAAQQPLDPGAVRRQGIFATLEDAQRNAPAEIDQRRRLGQARPQGREQGLAAGDRAGFGSAERLDGVRARAVALDDRQPAALRPAPVAVGDDGDVARPPGLVGSH